MRRLIAFFSFIAASAVMASVGLGPAGAVDRPADDPVRGLVYSGLQRSDRSGACHGNFEVIGRRDRAGRAVCTHGPDPAPEGVDVRRRHQIRADERSGTGAATPAPGSSTAAAAASVVCNGDGTSGYRVQLLYVHASDVTDRYASLTGSFQQWAGNLDKAFDNSAAETGASRHVRFVHDASCNAVVTDVTVSSTGDDDFDNTVTELQSQGFTRTDRKYVAWVDATVYCGMAQIYYDDRATPDNASNGSPTTQGEVARIDSGCWGQANSVEAHELMHTLGGVQASAPHATAANHCWDEYDRMCYQDADGVTLQYPCSPAHEALFDCNHDDYYSTAPAPGSYLATHWNTASSRFLIDAGSGRYNPLTPARILDTRDGTGAPLGPVGPGSTTLLQVTGRGGVPATGVSAVAMNVTVTKPTASSYLTIYPSGQPQPLAANLNFVGGQTVPNLVVVKVGADGRVAVFNQAGNTDVIADVAGWFSDPSVGNDGRLQPLSPARILDSRDGTGGGVRLGPGQSFDLQVSGKGGVPASGAAAAVMNVAVTNSDASSYLTAYPTGQPRPLAANLNWTPGLTVSNRTIVKLGTGGKVTLYNNSGSTDVVVDVNGWYTDATVSGGAGVYSALVPSRILDTRDGTGGISSPVASGGTIDVQVAGRGGVPATGASAVILNVTVTQPSAASYFTIFPTGEARPLAADLNFAPGENRPNLVVVKLGAGGKVSLFNSSGSAHVVFDVAGWFS